VCLLMSMTRYGVQRVKKSLQNTGLYDVFKAEILRENGQRIIYCQNKLKL
jgi:hypothetical protein